MIEKTRAIAQKYGPKLATGVLTLGTSALALAAAPDIDAEIAAAGTKMMGYVTAVIAIMVTFWAAKRAGQKMGWW